MNLTTQLRLILLVCGVVLLLGMYWFGRRKSSESGFKAQRFDPHGVEDNFDDDLNDDHSLQSFEEDEAEHEPLLVSEAPSSARSLQRSRDAGVGERSQLHDEETFIVESPASRKEPVWHDEEVSVVPSAAQWQVPVVDEEPTYARHVAPSETFESVADDQPVHAQPILSDAAALASESIGEVELPISGSPPLLLEEAAAMERAVIAEPLVELEPEPEPLPQPAPRPARAAAAPVAPASRKIMALRLAFVLERVAGAQLLSLLQGERLQLGKFNIFHRLHEQESVFSVASMVEPGTFDVQTMPSQHYVGVTFFTMLPGVMEAPMMFEQMLGCAERIAQATGGQLQDERGSKLSPYIVERLRDEVLDFQHLLGRASASMSADTAQTV